MAANQRRVAAESFDTVGRSHPIGATVLPGGVNFSLFSRGASGVDLLLFDGEEDGHPLSV
jgi:glycogen operon protein